MKHRIVISVVVLIAIIVGIVAWHSYHQYHARQIAASQTQAQAAEAQQKKEAQDHTAAVRKAQALQAACQLVHKAYDALPATAKVKVPVPPACDFSF